MIPQITSRTKVVGLAMAWLLAMPGLISAEESPKKPVANSAAKTDWRVLCDGTSLQNWKVTPFGGQGEVKVKDGAIVMQQGADLTGINWDGTALPKRNYEVDLDSKKLDGSDFFCGLVFAVGDSYCSFVVGGWGGGVVGLSAVDGMYADDNSTSTTGNFDDNRWYHIRLRVSEKYIQAWIDNKRVVNLDTTGKKISTHPAVDILKPLGVSCYATVAAVRNIRIRDLTPEESVENPKD